LPTRGRQHRGCIIL